MCEYAIKKHNTVKSVLQRLNVPLNPLNPLN